MQRARRVRAAQRRSTAGRRRALGAAPGGATEAEKAEWVSVLTSCNLDSYFRTLAEQGIGSVGQLCAGACVLRAGQVHRGRERAAKLLAWEEPSLRR